MIEWEEGDRYTTTKGDRVEYRECRARVAPYADVSLALKYKWMRELRRAERRLL